mgnify:CR=1 FL=1
MKITMSLHSNLAFRYLQCNQFAVNNHTEVCICENCIQQSLDLHAKETSELSDLISFEITVDFDN